MVMLYCDHCDGTIEPGNESKCAKCGLTLCEFCWADSFESQDEELIDNDNHYCGCCLAEYEEWLRTSAKEDAGDNEFHRRQSEGLL